MWSHDPVCITSINKSQCGEHTPCRAYLHLGACFRRERQSSRGTTAREVEHSASPKGFFATTRMTPESYSRALGTSRMWIMPS